MYRDWHAVLHISFSVFVFPFHFIFGIHKETSMMCYMFLVRYFFFPFTFDIDLFSCLGFCCICIILFHVSKFLLKEKQVTVLKTRINCDLLDHFIKSVPVEREKTDSEVPKL